MKKIVLSFLIVLISIIVIEVKADNSRQIYHAEKLEGITYVKIGGQTVHRYAYVQRRVSDNAIVYCIDAFKISKVNYDYFITYDKSEVHKRISPEKLDLIETIAYYGYGYGNHQDLKWYSITQLMIWKALEPHNTFEWTDSYGGQIIYPFESERKELQALVNNHYKKPYLTESLQKISIADETIITDHSGVLKKYEIKSSNIEARIEGNNLIINSKVAGDYEIKIKRKLENNKGPTLYFLDPVHQSLMTVGNYRQNEEKINIKLLKGSIRILKRDADTKGKSPRGSASLVGAKYQIINDGDSVVDTLEIDESLEAFIDNLPLGKYFIKEISSGNGYLLDETVYTVEITESNADQEITSYNKVIENKIEINKYYGNSDEYDFEANIKFNLYDSLGNLIEELITDEKGQIRTTLPFGYYKFVQQNTTEGYYKVEDLTIEVVESGLKQVFDLLDVKIPNASSFVNKAELIYYYKREDNV